VQDRSTAPVHHKLAASAVEAVEAGFGAAGTKMHAPSAAAMRVWVAYAIALVEAHIAGACGKPLPKRLWTGSGGIMWNRMLQWAVRDAGGEVTAFDHGSGNGHVLPEIYRTMFEYENADRFVTFTPMQAEGQREAMSPDLMIDPHSIALDNVAERRSKSAHRPTNDRPLKVMIQSSYYFGDVVTCEGFVPDLAMLDFEARLMAVLRECGYEVIYKPHPLIVTRAPYDVAATFGAIESTKPSEEALHFADVIVMLDPLSTAFATTLQSGKPAVLIDFGLARPTPKARALLAKRAGIVAAEFDAANRVAIDWNALIFAVESAPALSNEQFVNAYYGGAGIR
jgi:hypothetical protein